MKRLYSLGDSFMSTDEPCDGIVSFCELYCKQKQFKHHSLARPGATNFAIRLQIEKAIAEQADYVVVGFTSSDRFDIPLDTAETAPLYTLDNVFYTNYQAQSQRHVNQHRVKLVSDTFNNLVAQQHQTLAGTQHITALKHYIACLHNQPLAAQKDYYMLRDGIHSLQAAGIEFVLIPGWLSQHDWSCAATVWPNKPSPYDMPYGPSGWTTPPQFTATHNPAWAHQEFCETLLSITPDWC